jgi:hypothetical protein
VARGRGVDDREVEGRPSRARLELGEVPHLSDRHELGEPGGGRREVLEQRAPAEHPGQRPRLELIPEPLLLGPLRVHRNRRQVWDQLRKARLLRHFAQHHALAAPRRGEPERGREGRLSGPALAGYEDEALVQ